MNTKSTSFSTKRKVVSVLLSIALVLMLVPIAAFTSAGKAFAMETGKATGDATGTLTIKTSENGTIVDYGSADTIITSDVSINYSLVKFHVDDNKCLHIERSYDGSQASTTEDKTIIAKPDGAREIEVPVYKYEKSYESIDNDNVYLLNGAIENTNNYMQLPEDESSYTEPEEDTEANIDDDNVGLVTLASKMCQLALSPEKAEAASSVEAEIPEIILNATAEPGKIFTGWTVKNGNNEIDLSTCTGGDGYYVIRASEQDVKTVTVSANYQDGVLFNGDVTVKESANVEDVNVFFQANDGTIYYSAEYLAKEQSQQSNDKTYEYNITVPKDTDGIFYCISYGGETQLVKHTANDEAPDFEIEGIDEDSLGKITGDITYAGGVLNTTAECIILAYEGDDLKYATRTDSGDDSYELAVEKGKTYDLYCYAHGYKETICTNVSVPETEPCEAEQDIAMQLDTDNYFTFVVNSEDVDSEKADIVVAVDGVDQNISAGDENIAFQIEKNSHYSVEWLDGQLVITTAAQDSSNVTTKSGLKVNSISNALNSIEPNSVADINSAKQIVITPKAKDGYTFYTWHYDTRLGHTELYDEGFLEVAGVLNLELTEAASLTITDPNKLIENYTYRLYSTDTKEAAEDDPSKELRKTVFSQIKDFEMMTPCVLAVKNGRLFCYYKHNTNDEEEAYFSNFSIEPNVKSSDTKFDRWQLNGLILHEGESANVTQFNHVTAQPLQVDQPDPTTPADDSTVTSGSSTGDYTWAILFGILALAVGGYGVYRFSNRRESSKF